MEDLFFRFDLPFRLSAIVLLTTTVKQGAPRVNLNLGDE